MNRKIEAMHAYYGKNPGYNCAGCIHLLRNTYSRTYYKCEAYGDSASEATDWAKSYKACGLYNAPLEPGHVPMVKRLRAKTAKETQIDGQISLLKKGGKTMKPILFNQEMVQAILDGSKTQTRRIIKPQPTNPRWNNIGWLGWDDCHGYQMKPPYKPGDILWVRETWDNIPVSPGGHPRVGGRYYYKADGDIRPAGWKGKWHPSIHMPKEAARIFLRVKDVRSERLHDMNEEAAIAEGFEDSPAGTDSPLERFSVIWDKIIKREELREYGYHANPWVWVIGFERCEKPEGD